MAQLTDQQLLDAYKSALLALATAQSYTIDGQALTRASLPEIRRTIAWLESRVAGESGVVEVWNF